MVQYAIWHRRNRFFRNLLERIRGSFLKRSLPAWLGTGCRSLYMTSNHRGRAPARRHHFGHLVVEFLPNELLRLIEDETRFDRGLVGAGMQLHPIGEREAVRRDSIRRFGAAQATQDGTGRSTYRQRIVISDRYD